VVVDGWFVLREKYCWLVADKPNELNLMLQRGIQLQYFSSLSTRVTNELQLPNPFQQI
jgi:hypothetical protein